MSFLIRFPDEPLGHGAIGEKAVVLLKAGDEGILVPPWFVVTSEAFEATLSRDQADELRLAERVSTITEALAGLELHPSIQEQVLDALFRNGFNHEILALRPSLNTDDWDTIPTSALPAPRLAVRPDDVPAIIAEIWKSAFSERVLLHRRAHGLRLLPQAPSIIVQKMLRPEVSGMAFGVDLITGQQSVNVVAAVSGLSTSLTSGDCDADLYRVDRDRNIVTRDVADKRLWHQVNANIEGGVVSLSVPVHGRKEPCLTDAQVLAVDDLVRKVERLFECPQEVEWAIDDGRIWLLGSRSVAGLGRVRDPDARPVYWCSSLLAEFFPGTSTPLTASLLRKAIPSIARSFCCRMGLPIRKMERFDPFTEHLVGLIRGRVFCNLRHWYRIFAMLPDYPANVRYFGLVAGLASGLPAFEEAKLQPRWIDRIALVGSGFVMAANWFMLRHRIDKFESRVKKSLANMPQSWARARPDELIGAYWALERNLLASWDAPSLNDFFGMLSWALLNHASRLWCADETGALVNDLMTGRDANTQDDPREDLGLLAVQIAQDDDLTMILQTGSARDIRRRLRFRPALALRVEQLVEQYSDHALAELKIEAVDIQSDPLPLYRALGRMAAAPDDWHAGTGEEALGKAQEFVLDAIGGQPVRNAVFQWLIRQVLARTEDRSRLIDLRRRVVRCIREILLELGRRYYGLGLLKRPGDILFLEIDEALGCMDGAISSADPGSLAARRREEYEWFAQDDPAPSHFEERGPIVLASFPKPMFGAAGLESQRQGTGCCRGVVQGAARLVEKTQGAGFEAGDILVVSYSDPLWLFLYPTAGGLLIACAGQLSYGVVKARSLGVPTAIVGSALTTWLHDGDLVEMNGSTGLVTRIREAVIEVPPEPEAVEEADDELVVDGEDEEVD